MCHPALEMAHNEEDLIYPARVREFGVLASDELTRDFDTLNLVKSPID